MSDEFPINRGARQKDLLSPKLITAVVEEVFRKVGISEEITADGENLTNIRFANYVALFNEPFPHSPPPPPKKKTKQQQQQKNKNTTTTTNKTKQKAKKQKMEKHLSSLNSESLTAGLQIHNGKTKYVTNHAHSEDTQIDL